MFVFLFKLYNLSFSTRMMLAAVTSLLLMVLLGPWFIKILHNNKIKQRIRSESESRILASLHKNKSQVSTMGGILILFVIFVSIILWMDLRNIFTILLTFSIMFLGMIGFLDDLLKLVKKNSKGLKAKGKILLQITFTIVLFSFIMGASQDISSKKIKFFKQPIIKEKNIKQNTVKTLTLKEYLCRLYLPFIKKPIKNIYWPIIFVFMLFVILGSSNAVNLTDGLDGLASGLLILVASVLAMIAFISNHIELANYFNMPYVEGSGEIAVFLFSLIGAVLGFLWYNSYPAQIFMGDTGSLSLGGILGVCAFFLKKEILLAIIGFIFVIEAISVILQVIVYKCSKKRFFLCAPLHHHFEFKGLPETKVVIRFWIIGLIFSMSGILSLKFQF